MSRQNVSCLTVIPRSGRVGAAIEKHLRGRVGIRNKNVPFLNGFPVPIVAQGSIVRVRSSGESEILMLLDKSDAGSGRHGKVEG